MVPVIIQAAHIKFKVSPTLSSHFTKLIDLYGCERQEDIYLSLCLLLLIHAKWLKFIATSRHQRLWQLLNMPFNLGLLTVWDTLGVH